ncbi:Acyl dehydratase [Haloplanus vescus]|uniref:Acyl dehydratase n=1 Tax=Haloplanus vescus TaxID=555874 RepID=A0A1H3WC19_9EURY|nr:Acyl dehydratase [Haloplanus vescus]
MSERTHSSTDDNAWRESQKHLSNSAGHLYSSVLAANRAMIPGLNAGDDADADDRQPAPSLEITYTKPDWTFESSDDGDGVSVGDRVRFTKRLTDAEVQTFADASGDTNRLHLDSEFAEKTRFGRRIAHGTLVSGVISAALARLPGLTIYLSQELEFRGPVHIGEEVTAICEVVEDLGDDRYRVTTVVEDEDGETVIDGEAVVLIDDVPEDEA